MLLLENVIVRDRRLSRREPSFSTMLLSVHKSLLKMYVLPFFLSTCTWQPTATPPTPTGNLILLLELYMTYCWGTGHGLGFRWHVRTKGYDNLCQKDYYQNLKCFWSSNGLKMSTRLYLLRSDRSLQTKIASSLAKGWSRSWNFA